MGRTVPTYRMHLESVLEEWRAYGKALREKDRALLEEVLTKARMHASAGTYCANLDPVETALLSILLEVQRDLHGMRDMDMHLHTQSDMARNIAVADDVYETLSKAKLRGESFSDVIRRWHRGKGDLLQCYGLLADLSDEEFERFRGAALGVDRPLTEELGRGEAPK